MNEDEVQIKELLEKKFDSVVRPEKGTYKWNSLTEHIRLGAHLSREMNYLKPVKLDHFIQPGVPDFLAYSGDYQGEEKVITDYLFVEVKKGNDTLSVSQLNWFNRFPKLNAQVVIHDPDEKKVKSFEPPVVNMVSNQGLREA